jgi:hypothetical protein
MGGLGGVAVQKEAFLVKAALCEHCIKKSDDSYSDMMKKQVPLFFVFGVAMAVAPFIIDMNQTVKICLFIAAAIFVLIGILAVTSFLNPNNSKDRFEMVCVSTFAKWRRIPARFIIMPENRDDITFPANDAPMIAYVSIDKLLNGKKKNKTESEILEMYNKYTNKK